MLKRIVDESVTVSVSADTQYSKAWNLDNGATVSIQAVMDETSVSGGAIAFQHTNIRETGGKDASSTAADWADIEDETAVTADATVFYEKVGLESGWIRVRGTASSGTISIVCHVIIRGEDKN